jgi:ribosome-associated protein
VLGRILTNSATRTSACRDSTRGFPIGSPQPDPDRTRQREASRQTAVKCAQLADEYRCRDIVVLDLTELTPIVDYFVIATGTSPRQMHAVAEEIHRVLKSRGHKRLGREGFDAATWILADYGDVALHLFDEATRKKYDLERLWADATPVDWKASDATTAEE